MATKVRKDKKGYALRTGECQRATGQYSFTYTDRKGIKRSIYSKSLMTLREREKQLILDYDRGLDPFAAKKITVNQLYEKYMSQKSGLSTLFCTIFIRTFLINGIPQESYNLRLHVCVCNCTKVHNLKVHFSTHPNY